MLDLSAYEEIFNLLVEFSAISMPLVVVFGIVGRVFNFVVAMVTGERKVNL